MSSAGNPSEADPKATEAQRQDFRRVALLDAMRREGRAWADIAPPCGVADPEPPWKTCLDATCECLDAGGALPSLDRRLAEDALAEAMYGDVPNPERQLLALVHTMLSRGLIGEAELARRVGIVRSRLAA
ncbi:MAG: thiocyanate hydrolase [Alphaproteobacteria bacterium]|nr:thiocyanate hydrolase [Alphaproteobacteria bacterium]